MLLAGHLLEFAKGLFFPAAFHRPEPKRRRYRLLHSAGIIVSSGRRRFLRLAKDWPWSEELAAAFARLRRHST